MKFDKWLTINSRGAGRITANKPALAADEIAVHLLMDVPNQLFWRPTIEAKVTIPDEAVPPVSLDAHVVEQVGDAIRQATGLDVVLSVSDTPPAGNE